MIYLHTLGDTLIKVDEKEIRPTSPLLFAALLYLGMERGHRVPRAALQEMLFPKVDQRSGAHSMRQLLYKLRQLGTPVSASGDALEVDASAVSDDVLVLRASTASHVDPARFAKGFLPGYDAGLSAAYEEWLEQTRRSVEAGIRRDLITALGTSRAAADWTAVERLARAVLALDPFNEEATLALAEATALVGSKLEALEILDRYAEDTGRSELQLPVKVLRRRISEQVPERRSASRWTPFVGRAKDAEVVEREIARAADGTARLLVITGEPGIGKSRLISEALARAGLGGARTASVKCRPHHVQRPFGVLLELVPLLLALPGALGISPQSLEHLKLLVSPGDRRVEPPTDSRDAATRSGLLVAALRDLIDAVAAEQTLVIVVEDIHWADVDSIRELAGITTGLPARPLIAIFSARTMPSATRLALVAESASTHELGTIRVEAMSELARHLLEQGNADADVASWCVETAAGNPLFLEMLCEHYLSAREAFRVPQSLKALIGQRLEQLSPQCRRVVELSALLGRNATVDALRSLSEMSQTDLVTAVQRLEEERFIQLNDGGARLTHDLLGQSAIDLLPPLTRSVLHTMTATYLESQYDVTKNVAVMWDCAEQWFLSGDRAKAMRFLVSCARYSVDVGRPNHAVDLLQRAEQFTASDHERNMVYEQIMIAARAADQWPTVYNASRKLRRHDERGAHDAIEMLAINAKWEATFTASDVVEQLRTCATCTSATTEHRLEAASLLLRIAHECGLLELAHGIFSAIEPLLAAESDCIDKWTLPLIYHTSFGDRDRALTIARSLRDTVPTLDIEHRFRFGLNLGVAFGFLGLHDENVRIFADYYDQAKLLGLGEWQFEYASGICWSYTNRHQFAEAEVWRKRSAELADNYDIGRHTIRPIAARAELALARGDIEAAGEAYRELEKIGGGESVRSGAYIDIYPIRIKLLDPEYCCTDEELRQLSEIYARVRTLGGLDYLIVTLTDALTRAGQVERAIAELDGYITKYRRERTPAAAFVTDLRLKLGRRANLNAQAPNP